MSYSMITLTWLCNSLAVPGLKFGSVQQKLSAAGRLPLSRLPEAEFLKMCSWDGVYLSE